MCISIFAFKKSILIEYASESISLRKRTGIPEIVVDLLIKNNSVSKGDISDIYCIVPQQLFNSDGSIPFPFRAEDITEDMVGEKSQYTRVMVYGLRITQDNTYLDLTLPDPFNNSKNVTYTGVFCGNNKVEAIESTPEMRVLMNYCLFGVFRVILGRPIKPNEQRWLRWRICPFTGPQELRNFGRHLSNYLRNDITLSYNVSGPAKVAIDVNQKITNLYGEIVNGQYGSASDQGMAIDQLNGIRQILITDGVNHSDTTVEICDWRTRFFRLPMEPFMNIHMEDYVRIVGGQPIVSFPENQGDYFDEYYEWASGSKQLAPPAAQLRPGEFSIRFTTRFIPLIHRIGPLIGPIIALIALILSIINIILRHSTR